MYIYILLTYPKTYIGYDINPVIELSSSHCIAALNARVWNSDRYVERLPYVLKRYCSYIGTVTHVTLQNVTTAV